MARGMLVFKGDDPKKKKKKKSKHTKKNRDDGDDDNHAASSRSRSTSSSAEITGNVARMPPSATQSSALPPPKVVSCSGKITSSGTVVTGHGTRFEKEISAGDALIAIVQGQQQMRVVTMRLSNMSLNLSSGFTESIKIPATFSVIRKPRDITKQKRLKEESAKLSKKEEEEKASGTFGSTDDMIWRERTEHGSYRIRREKVEGVSRGDLLNMRSKKTSDKYC